jgi:N-acetylmuramidase
MEWKGAAKKLEPGDLKHAADAIGCDVKAIKAVMSVECKGSGFDKSGRLVLLFEPHIFYRELSKSAPGKLNTAVKQGLAAKSWGQIKYGKMSEQYPRIDKAIMIDETAALRSASYGLGQTMGFNDHRCGFKTAKEMVDAYKASEAAQLMGMVAFIKSSHLDDELRNHDWAGFANGYNGSGYKKNHYDEKLAQAYKAAK